MKLQIFKIVGLLNAAASAAATTAAGAPPIGNLNQAHGTVDKILKLGCLASVECLPLFLSVRDELMF